MSRLRAGVAALIATVTVAAALSGCGSSGTKTAAGSTPASAGNGTLSGSITVLAASSLTGTFTQLGKQFSAAHPGVKVTFSFGSSAQLATQIVNDAPADVFAAASTSTMQTVVAAHDAQAPVTFARNYLEIATAPGNRRHVRTPRDLGAAGLKLALCQAQVPCGAAAATMLSRAKVAVHPVTLEQDVKSTLSKVTTGEVDAGVVYVTDVLAAGKAVTGVPIPPAENVATAYPIAALTHARNAPAAAAFAAYVESAAGSAMLRAAGFARP